ncbi:MAG TPA: protein kinase, partial [Minicystis sp.]|nr:protein kinase [Minicystis sp.]
MTKEATSKPRPATPPGPTPAAILKRALAHWPIAAAVMLVGALATAQVVRMRKPAFKSETVIFYREGIQRSFISNDPGAPDPLRTLGAKLKEMLLAQSNLKKILREKHLYQDIVQKQDENAAVEQFRKKI